VGKGELLLTAMEGGDLPWKKSHTGGNYQRYLGDRGGKKNNSFWKERRIFVEGGKRGFKEVHFRLRGSESRRL